MTAPYSEGFIAGSRGDPLGTNPYPVNDSRHTNWANGWTDGWADALAVERAKPADERPCSQGKP